MADVTYVAWCEAHPWLPFGHPLDGDPAGCPGPGAPVTHARAVLEDACAVLSKMAAGGNHDARRWLAGHGIVWDAPDGWTTEGGPY